MEKGIWDWRLAVFAMLTLYAEGAEWWATLEPYKRGYYQGYIMFEVVATVVAGLVTVEAAGAGAAAWLARHTPRLMAVLRHVIPKLRAMTGKLGDAAEAMLTRLTRQADEIALVHAGGWCFVAGTMICTTSGAVPIEQIRVGDWVLSADEDTGEIGFNPVMELYRNVSDEIWTVAYDGDNDSSTPPDTLRCTGGHPFWSENAGAFVDARSLSQGDGLRLVSGEVVRVVSVLPERGPPGRKVAIYNFAVADHHTYFAGQGGVWVHNLCSAKLDEYASTFETILKGKIDDLGDTHAAWKAASDEVVDIMKLENKGGNGLSESDFVDIASYITLRKANKGIQLPQPIAWRHAGDVAPDPRLVEEAKAFRTAQGLLDTAGMNRNVAVAKLEVDGTTRFIKAANQKFPDGTGSIHSEELLAGQIDALRAQGKNVKVEELFTERIPCKETGGCRPMITKHMQGAKVFFWTSGQASKSKAGDLMKIYGLGN